MAAQLEDHSDPSQPLLYRWPIVVLTALCFCVEKKKLILILSQLFWKPMQAEMGIYRDNL